MSQFPEYLEEWLKIVELNIHLYRSTEKAHELVNRLREHIERYEHERVSVAMIDRAIDAAKLARLEKLESEVKSAAEDLYCPDSCSDERCVGPCDCAVGRLKSALEP